jgi:FKBP-type peptidyl-prolyl cis-trans isomerase FklB
MKQYIMVALALLVVGATFSSVQAQSAARIDSLSYSMGMAQTQGLKDYLAKQLKIDVNYMDDFVKGLKEGVAESSQAKAAYYAGTQIGQQILRQMMPGLNKELFGAESTKSISLDQFMAGFISGVTGKDGKMTVDSANQVARRLMEQVKNDALMEQYGDNKKAGEDFIAAQAKLAKKKKSGITVLPSGLI